MQVHELPLTVAHQVRDAFYISVGLGVIAVTNLRGSLDAPEVDLGAVTGAIDALNERLETVATELDERFSDLEARLDTMLDQVEDGLPDHAREVVANARGAAKEARAQLRSLAGLAA